MNETELLQSIYDLLLQLVPFVKLATGVVQFIIVMFAIVVLYKLFKIFF